MDEPSRRRVARKKIWAFCSADFGFNLYYSGLSLFLLYYYTDVIGIRPAAAGLIFALPLLWDAVTDPLMGAIASRIPSRFGRFRVFVLFGAVPLAVSFVLMFLAPLAFLGQVLVAAAATHILFRTAYTVVSIPYSALSANLTADSGERGSIAGMRMIFATTGGLFTVLATLPLVGIFGDGDPSRGFVAVGALYALISTGFILIAFFNSKEAAFTTPTRQFGLREIGITLMRNRALLILISGVTVAATGAAIFGKMLIYFIVYVANVDLSITQALVSMTAAASFSIPFWMALSKGMEKRTIWLIGGAGVALGQIILFIAPLSEGLIVSVLLWIGFANGAFYVTFWSMLPDTVEYGQWRSGIRDEGLVFGVNQLALKAAAGIGIGVLGFLLEGAGYIAGVEQTADTVGKLQLMTTLLPCALGLAGMLIISLYPVDKALHRRLLLAIGWRDARASATDLAADRPARPHSR